MQTYTFGWSLNKAQLSKSAINFCVIHYLAISNQR